MLSKFSGLGFPHGYLPNDYDIRDLVPSPIRTRVYLGALHSRKHSNR